MIFPNVLHRDDYSKFIESMDNGEEILFFKDKEYFDIDADYDKYIKEVEKMVRTSQRYRVYVGYIKGTLGINFCQASSNIFESKNVQIEMHHGPLFTLYDICEVILNWFIQTKQRITTFRVANKVLDEHYALRVQTIMLSVTNHEGVHNRDIFTHVNQAIGNVNEFINLYHPYLSDDQKYKIWNYIHLCEDSNFGKSFDTGLLNVDHIKKYIQL